MTEKQYRLAWMAEIECGIAAGRLTYEGKRATLRSAAMTPEDYEEYKRNHGHQ